ncbi:MAG: ABC transporter permease [Egibacteraceae bacterium]
MSAATETQVLTPPEGTGPTRVALYALARLAVVLLFVAGWALATQVTDLVPAVPATLAMLVNGFVDGWIYPHVVSTTQAVLLGFAVASLTGFPAGFLVGRNRWLSDVFDPLISGAFAVPRIIFFPILLRMFGVGQNAEAAMAAISAFFPIVITTAAGVREVSPTLVKMGRSMNLSTGQMVRKIYVPAAAPSLMVGFRIGFSISFIAVIIAEFFAAKAGLGLLASRAYGLLQLPRMYAVVLLILVIALAGNLSLWLVERRLRANVA